MTGAGEHVDRLPRPGAVRARDRPVAARALDARRSTRRSTGSATPAHARGARAARPPPRCAGEPPPRRQRPRGAARSLCPAIDDALAVSARRRWSPAPARPCSGSSPTPAAAPRRRRRARSRARSPPSRSAPPSRRCAPHEVGLAARRAGARGASYRPPPQARPLDAGRAAGSSSRAPRVDRRRRGRAAELRGADARRRPRARQVDLPARRRCSRSWRPARSSGSIAPGETTVIVGGLVAGQGEISLCVLIAIVWVCAVLGDLTSYTAGRKLGRAWLLAPRRAAEDHRGAALQQVEGFFERAAGSTILDRPLHRLRARARAVHRRHHRGCRCAASCPTTCSAPAPGPRRSRRSASSSGARSTSSRPTSRAGCSRSATVSWWSSRRSSCSSSCGATRRSAAQVRGWLDERRDRPGWRWLVRLADPAWRLVGRPAAAVADLAGALRRRPPHAGQARARADDAARAAASSALFSFFFLGEHRLPARRAADRRAGGRHRRAGWRSTRSIEVAKVVTELGSFPVVAASRRWPRRLGASRGGAGSTPRALVAAGAVVAARPHRQGGLRPRAPDRRARRRRQRRLPVRPRRVLRRAGRLRDRARARGDAAGRCASRPSRSPSCSSWSSA